MAAFFLSSFSPSIVEFFLPIIESLNLKAEFLRPQNRVIEVYGSRDTQKNRSINQIYARCIDRNTSCVIKENRNIGENDRSVEETNQFRVDNWVAIKQKIAIIFENQIIIAIIRGETGSQTYGFLEYHKIRKWMYVSRL